MPVRVPAGLRLCVALLGLSMLAGCASSAGPGERSDPLEPFNRQVYAFNSDFDTKIGKPVAESYQRHVPSPVRTGVSNFFSNLNDVVVIVNDLLQLKGGQAASDTLRFSVNTVFGLFGLLDIATPSGLPKHDEDFGQTLGYWGVGTGPYIVLPFLGPNDARDTVGLVGDSYANPLWDVRSTNTKWGLVALRAVDTRASLLKASRVLQQAALDPYVFVRDAYLQRRRSLVYDGNPPREKFEDFDDDFELPPDKSAPSPKPKQ
ncbi:MAG TPA: VacJ family lipoprotein [Gammaproteobacteria bacterium]|nr:VacJ family lipoprotein [Gammaproteobacteria bacterium]